MKSFFLLLLEIPGLAHLLECSPCIDQSLIISKHLKDDKTNFDSALKLLGLEGSTDIDFRFLSELIQSLKIELLFHKDLEAANEYISPYHLGVTFAPEIFVTKPFPERRVISPDGSSFIQRNVQYIREPQLIYAIIGTIQGILIQINEFRSYQNTIQQKINKLIKSNIDFDKKMSHCNLEREKLIVQSENLEWKIYMNETKQLKLEKQISQLPKEIAKISSEAQFLLLHTEQAREKNYNLIERFTKDVLFELSHIISKEREAFQKFYMSAHEVEANESLLKIKLAAEKDMALAKQKAEHEAEITNADVRLRSLITTKEIESKAHIDIFKNKISTIQSAILEISVKQILTFLTIILLSTLGLYGAKDTTGLIRNILAQKLGSPSLLREIKVYSKLERIKRCLFPISIDQYFESLILPNDIMKTIIDLSLSINLSRREGLNFTNALFFGSPGTGKTMTARLLAKSCGLDYAMLSGADIAPLGNSAVTNIHSIFNWGNNSSRGILLFIDEADALLLNRTESSEVARNVQTALLYHTGQPQNKVFIVIASNSPDIIDSAFKSRICTQIHFGLPVKSDKIKMCKQYFSQLLEVQHNMITISQDFEKKCIKQPESPWICIRKGRAITYCDYLMLVNSIKIKDISDSNCDIDLLYSINQNDLNVIAELPISGRDINNIFQMLCAKAAIELQGYSRKEIIFTLRAEITYDVLAQFVKKLCYENNGYRV